MVDLPGYGFAYAKEEVKEAWEDLVSVHNGLGNFNIYNSFSSLSLELRVVNYNSSYYMEYKAI